MKNIIINKKIGAALIFLFLLIVAFCGYLYMKPAPVIDINTKMERPNIIVHLPKRGDALSFPFVIKGEARVFENVLDIRIIDKKTNKIIYEETAMANASDVGQFGKFSKTIDYFLKRPESEDLIIEALWFSPKDGSELDKISIPVKIKMEDANTLKVFFNNNIMDSQVSCNKVFPVERLVAKTEAPARKAIELLLGGIISKSEKEEGYSTSINYGVKINRLAIENNTAEIDLDEQLEFEVGGSCKVSAIRAQITETLKQFETVKDVIISINGRTEDILQP